MAYTPITNLLEIAQDEWTPSQFRDKFIYQSLLKAMTDELQSLEDLFSQMYSDRNLNVAVGVQLDNMGENLGVTRRLGQSDEEYRTAIFAEIFMRRSDGTGNYIMNALKSIYNSPTAKIFEHNTLMTGGVIVVVNQPVKIASAVEILKKMSPVAIQSVTVLRDPTPLGYAWVPVEVEASTGMLVTSNNEWFITDGGLGVVVQTGAGQLAKSAIGSFGDAGLQVEHLGLDAFGTTNSRLAILAKNQDGLLQVEKETAVGGAYGVMAEVSQLRMGQDTIEGEQ